MESPICIGDFVALVSKSRLSKLGCEFNNREWLVVRLVEEYPNRK